MSSPSCYYLTQVFRFMQPCHSVGLRPTVSSPLIKSPISVFDPNHAPTPMKCDVPVHMQCNVPLQINATSHCNEYHMDNINHTIYLVSWTIISHAYNFKSKHSFQCQYIRAHISTFHQVNTTTHAITKESNNNLDHQTNCGI